MNKIKSICTLFMAIAMFSFACKESKKMSEADNKDKNEVNQPQTPKSDLKVIVDPTYMHQTTDDYSILESNINGDILTLLVQYGGGCETHEWALKTNGAYAKSLPPQITLNLEHNANNDMCRALLRDTLEFNIKDVRYPGSFELIVKLHNFEKTKLVYRYN